MGQAGIRILKISSPGSFVISIVGSKPRPFPKLGFC